VKERIFIQTAKEHIKLEEFIRQQLSQARVGEIEVQHTPVVTRIIIHTTTPGLIIGTGGERIREIMEAVKKDFGIQNPQIDVQRIDNPDLDPAIIAQTIAASVEAGINYKRLGAYSLERIMEAGAVGCEIIFAGKFSGQRGKKDRFIAGYLKKCGEPAEKDVVKGFAKAIPKLGVTGVTVKIMLRQPETLKLKRAKVEKVEERKEAHVHTEEEKKVEEGLAEEQKEEVYESKGEEYGHR
jgi:small subunit ribosomal protein S3